MAMDFSPLKITIETENSVFFDASAPPMLDAILAWSVMPFKRQAGEAPGRDDAPEEVSLPLATWEIDGVRGWRASALLPVRDDVMGHIAYWRKRAREGMLPYVSGSINTQNGPYRSYNTPMPMLASTVFEGCVVGNRDRVRRALKQLKYLGKKRAMGFGRITSIVVERCGEDHSIVKGGVAMRWLPSKTAVRAVRVMPPYWSNVGRVLCCEVGDAYSI